MLPLYVNSNCVRMEPSRVSTVVEALRGNSLLEKVVLAHKPLYDRGASVLADLLRTGSSIKHLEVSSCRFSDVGCIQLDCEDTTTNSRNDRLWSEQ